MAENAQAAAEQAPPGRRKNVVMLGVLVGVMVIEALVVFVLVKSFSSSASPSAAEAAGASGLIATEGQKAAPRAEVKVGDFRAQNRKGQQSYLLQFSVYAAVVESDRAKLEEAVAAKSATIQDRFTRVVRAMDPERFVEPDLTTLRVQLQDELGQVLGSELKLEEVLLTDFTSALDS